MVRAYQEDKIGHSLYGWYFQSLSFFLFLKVFNFISFHSFFSSLFCNRSFQIDKVEDVVAFEETIAEIKTYSCIFCHVYCSDNRYLQCFGQLTLQIPK